MSEKPKRKPTAWNEYFSKHSGDDNMKELKPKDRMKALAEQFKMLKQEPKQEAKIKSVKKQEITTNIETKEEIKHEKKKKKIIS